MSEIEKLVEVSREYGSDDKYVIAGGGNTSFKTRTNFGSRPAVMP